MKERLESRTLSGNINVACKYDDGTVRYWQTTKEEVISHIVYIVNQYTEKGYILTLRQLHYQLVTRNWIINHDTAYKKLGNILDDCRYAGIIDWDAIEDRGRQPYIHYSADDLADGLFDLQNQYRIDRQEGQENYVELWTEKDALSGILRRSTEKYHVQLVVNKGYTSSSAIYAAYSRITEQIIKGKKVTILYFGDHDPSGLDMIRDITDRLTLFITRGENLNKGSFYQEMEDWWKWSDYSIYTLMNLNYTDKPLDKLLDGNSNGSEDLENEFYASRMKMYLDEKDYFKVRAIGLTKDQINQYNLPSNPAKLTDSRAKEYIKRHGKISWEVDALEPEVLTAIVEENIESIIDIPLYNRMIDREQKDIDKLDELIKMVKE